MTRTPVDKHRIERSTREAQITIKDEQQAREAKTARLKEQRLALHASLPTAAVASKKPSLSADHARHQLSRQIVN